MYEPMANQTVQEHVQKGTNCERIGHKSFTVKPPPVVTNISKDFRGSGRAKAPRAHYYSNRFS